MVAGLSLARPATAATTSMVQAAPALLTPCLVCLASARVLLRDHLAEPGGRQNGDENGNGENSKDGSRRLARGGLGPQLVAESGQTSSTVLCRTSCQPIRPSFTPPKCFYVVGT